MEIVIAGSNNSFKFAVIDFTNPGSPTVVTVTPPSPFAGGCMVDVDGTLAAIGDFNGSTVVLYDISNPAAPVQKGLINTTLSGIGAISINGTRVVAGELNGLRAVLLDVSNPSTPAILSTHNTGISSISAIALSGNKAAVAGPNDLAFSIIDYTNPASPTHVKFLSGTQSVFFNGPLTIDLDGTRAAVADMSAGTVNFFDVSGAPTFLGKKVTVQQGVSSLSISGNVVGAASTNNVAISLVNFQNPASPVEVDLNVTGLNGGATIKLAGNRLAAGDVLGQDVALFSVSGTTATALGKVNSTLASIGTIAFSTFVVQTPASISSSVSTFSFGTVRVGTTVTASPPIVLHNSGSAALSISNLKTTAPQYVVTPTGALTIAGLSSTTLDLKFTPTASTNFPAQITMATNDTAHPTFSITLSGAGGLPKLVLPATPIDFGNVAVCLSHVLNVTISNSGPVSLNLSGIAISGTGFSHAGATTLVVPPNGSNSIAVTFAPSATGNAAGTLSFNSDDPTAPSASLSLQGVGTPKPPAQINVTPTFVDFGAVPLQYFIGVKVTVANIAPCEALVANLVVTGSEYVLTTGNPTTVPVTNSPIPATILANSSQDFTVIFAPTALGAGSGTLTITSNDPAKPTVTIPLQGNGVAVSPAAVELILDRSGSMATAIAGGTRMDALKSAVNMFADLVIPSTGFSMGSVQFDDQFATLTPLLNFDATQQTKIKTDAGTLSPRNLTSIGGGLSVAQTELTASAQPRKVAIVFTDGFENTAPLIASVEPGIVSAGTEVYAVGLGDPAYLSVASLSELAATTNGKFFQTTDPLVLRKQFVEILADAFRLNMAADPILTLQQGVPLSVPVNITNCESRISFVLLWEDPNAQVQLSIQAPDGTTFNPTAGNNNRLVRFIAHPGYRFYQIALPPGPGKTIGPKQLGTWIMKINPILVAGGTTRAATNVMVEGALQFTARVSASTVVNPILLRSRLQLNGNTVSGAKVRVKVTSPVTSLAALSTPLVRHIALAADTHLIPASQQILTKTQTKEFEARFNEREYILQLPAPLIDGVYHVEVTATGQACGGVFERYWSSSVYVAPRGKVGVVGVNREFGAL